MKVLFVINSSNNGGAIKMIVTLYMELRKVYPSSNIVFLKRIESQYSNIEGAYYLSDDLNSVSDYFTVGRKLYQVIALEKPDALISFLPLANIFTAVLGKILGVKIRIASQRNPPYIYGKIVRLVDRFIGSRGYYTANVCNSQAGMDAFSSYPTDYRRLLSVINNCVEPVDTLLDKQSCRSGFQMGTNEIVLTCVGRLHDQKNHRLLIESLQYIPNAKLYLAGDGPLRTQLEVLVDDLGLNSRVCFMGDLDRAQVKKLLCASDIFVIPSKYEGLSNSLIEAMSYGLPIVFSNIPSFTSFLKNDDGTYAGVLVENNDSIELSDKVNLLINNEPQRKYYGQQAIEKTKELTAEKMTEKFIQLLHVKD